MLISACKLHVWCECLPNNVYVLTRLSLVSHYFIIQKFGFIKGVDNVNWPPYRDSKSWRFER